MADDIIGESLGLDPMSKPALDGEIVEYDNSPKEVKAEEDNSDNDYKYARENFYSVIETGTKALEQMLDVAQASEHPRAYEVVSTLMKTLVDANKDLVKMNEDRKKSKAPEEQDHKSVTNNNLFVGSTSELQKMLKDLKDDG